LADCDWLDWAFYQGELTATDDIQGADFEIHLTKAGSVEFDLISIGNECVFCSFNLLNDSSLL